MLTLPSGSTESPGRSCSARPRWRRAPSAPFGVNVSMSGSAPTVTALRNPPYGVEEHDRARVRLRDCFDRDGDDAVVDGNAVRLAAPRAVMGIVSVRNGELGFEMSSTSTR